MLQRVQSLFLLGALALMVAILFCPFIYLPTGEKLFIHHNRPLLMLTLIAIAAIVGTILLYKSRMIQIRICIYNSVILIGLQAWIIYYLFYRTVGTSFSITAVFPLAAVILTLLAMRYIGRDEAIVRSMNRLRKK